MTNIQQDGAHLVEALKLEGTKIPDSVGGPHA